MSILEQALSLSPKLIAIRRYLHQHAEVHNELPETVAYVSKHLQSLGLDPKEISKSGLTVTIDGTTPGKVFLLRADMDALPMKEQTDLPFQSLTENMHACGHDLHTTMLLGAAELLYNNKDQIEGSVKLMFQPAEETLAGAKQMIDAGILENPTVDAAMMIHVFAGISAPTGVAFYMTNGPAMASSDWFDIHIQGQGGHGAVPNQSIDPLVVMSKIHLSLLEINGREVDPNQFLVITPCRLEGGTTGNIIPDTAFMQGTIRTFNETVRTMAKERVKEIAVSIGKAFRCDVTVTFHSGCPSLINNKELNTLVTNATRDLLGHRAVVDYSKLAGNSSGRMGGSEDFAFISERVPSTILGLAANLPDQDGTSYGQHHPKVKFDENVLPIGAAIYANAAIEYLKKGK